MIVIRKALYVKTSFSRLVGEPTNLTVKITDIYALLGEALLTGPTGTGPYPHTELLRL